MLSMIYVGFRDAVSHSTDVSMALASTRDSDLPQAWDSREER